MNFPVDGTDILQESKCHEEVKVDIINCTNKYDSMSHENEDPNATEYSSSFADTASDADIPSEMSEGEVDGRYFGDAGLPSAFDAFSSALQMRKKKLTTHWRNFIRPLMWRCKWTELRIKEIESQARKYSRKLLSYDQCKCSGFDPFMLEEFGSKSMPFSSQCLPRKAMKRRKRKRVEETNDLTSYMSQHNLFSYLENKRSDPDGTSTAEDLGNLVITEKNLDCDDKYAISNGSVIQFGDGDNPLEELLWKIEIVHSRLHKLRSQIDVVMSKNVARFSSSENLSLLAPCDAQTSSAPSPTLSAGNADTVSVSAMYATSQHIPEFEIGDLVMCETAISGYGEAIAVPDIIESTAGLLTAADVTLPETKVEDLSEGIVDNVLIHCLETEGHVVSRSDKEQVEAHQEPEKGKQGGESPNESLVPASQSGVVAKALMSEEQSALKSLLASDVNFPRNKRKRGERKASLGSWKKHAGEPDSQ